MPTRLFPLLLLLSGAAFAQGDPRTNSWLTAYSTQYARIYANDAARLAGTSLTTWSNGTQNQALPAYCGVQEIAYSANWVYLRTSGLPAHIMGPWYLNAARTTVFPNQPVQTKAYYRIPRITADPATKTRTGLGTIGFFVDGVAMFDSSDGFYWNGAAEAGGGGTGYWNRDAYVNEGVTFDPGFAHQEMTGTHHYHANPIALRYLLGDHVDFNPTTKFYSESTAPVTRHSPILGWVRDGYPVYGPYGYASALDANSGVRRMVSGYQLRNGQNGADNLTSARATIPAWAQRLYGVSANQSGPTVSATYPLGRYQEDNAYLGDLGRTQGVEFDLDEYNGRFCVTPEFPGGTYAYFTAISAAGAPVYPYNIGRAFRGSPTGAAVTTLSEAVTTTFRGGTNVAQRMISTNVAANGSDVVVSWASLEGGTYQIERSTNLTSWTVLAPTVTASAGVVTSATDAGAATGRDRLFYRAARTALANHDPIVGSGGGGGGGAVAPGGSASRGTTVTVTITLPTTPPNPPANVMPTSVTLAGTIVGTGTTRPNAATVVTTFNIPANAPTGLQTIVVVFPMPTYTMTNAFTIN